MRAAVLEYVLADPTRGFRFLDQINEGLEFRRVYVGFYTSVEGTLVRVRAPKPKTLDFCLEKLQKVRQALKEEEQYLVVSRKEVSVREKRVEYLRTTLVQG